MAIGAFAAVLVLAGCLAPEVTVLRQPHQVKGLEGKRPMIYVYLDRADPAQWYVQMRTPRGKLLLKAGPAIVASYAEGLKRFFYVVSTSRYHDYLAYVDPFTMVFEGGAELVEGGVRVRMHVRHDIPILWGKTDLLESIPLEASLDETIPYTGDDALERECARLFGTLLAEMEDRIAEYLISNDSPGKYRIPD